MAGQYFPLCLLVLVSWTTYYVECAPPTELTLDVALVPPYDTIADHYIGSMTKMEIKVAFPQGPTALTIIELLPSTNVTVMALGEITVTAPSPSKIASISGSEAITRHITDETLGKKVQLSTRAVINLGDVVVTDTSGPEADYTYIIQFEAFVVSVEGLADNDTHWVSAGVEYDNSNNIWVGQILHYIRTGTLINGKIPLFKMENVTEIKRLSSYPVTFEAWVPYPTAFIAIEAIALSTTDDHMRVVRLKCISGGTNYEFSTPTMINYPLLETSDVDCATDPAGARRLRVELGNLTNKGSRDGVATGSQDKLKFEALVHMKGTSVLNDEYPFGVGVEIDGSEVWVGTLNVTAALEDPIIYSLNGISAADSITTKSVGEAFLVKVSIEFPRERGLMTTVYKLETAKNPAGDPGIMISQAFVADSGLNVECGSVTTTFESSVPGGLNDIAYVTITATNHGLNTSNSVDDLIHIHVAMVGIIGQAVDGATYDVTATSNETSAQTQTISYSMSGTATFDTNTNHTFDLTSDCGSDQVIPEGTTFDLILTVTTQRGSNPESLQLEFPIPANITDGVFVVCGIEVVKLGKNLICFTPAQAIASANYTTLGDGTHEYVAMNIQPACNADFFDDVEEDKLVLRIKSRFKTGVTLSSGVEYWFGIGSKYTATQIWVAQFPIQAQPVYAFSGPAIITGINALISNYTLPGSYNITRSYDGVTFTTISLDVGTATNNGSHHAYPLNGLIMARNAGLITENCNSACGLDYDFTYVSLKDYIDIFGDNSQAILSSMINVLDNNPATCLNLPVQGQNPPVFWARINTTMLNINLQSFTLNVTGTGISCERHGAERVLQVSISYPVSSSVGRFHGEVKYCKNTYSDIGTKNTCGYTCMCPNTAECSEVIIFLANGNSGGSWEMCDLSAANI